MRYAKFNRNIKLIDKYYRKLIKKANKKENIDTVNAWIIDNYYLISEQHKAIAHDIMNAWFIRLKKKNKQMIEDFVDDLLKQKECSLQYKNLCFELRKYQLKNKYYFSYTEMDYLYVYIKYKLIDNLVTLCQKLEYKGVIKEKINNIFLKVHNELINNNFDIKKYIKINLSILNHPYYVEQLSYKLKELGDAKEDLIDELNQLLKENNQSLKQIIEEQQNDYAMNNLLTSNIFKTIKDIVRIQEIEIYEKASFTEGLLRSEAVAIYKNMTDKTKKSYRAKILKLSRKDKFFGKEKNVEYRVASKLIEKADKENKHIGFYLFKEPNHKLRTFIYLSVITLITFILCYISALSFGIVAFFILLIPINHLVIQIVNQVLFHVIKIKSIFQMDFKKGLSKENSTMVVIPTIVSNKEKILKMFDNLEIYYLSNKSENIYYTLLGDCTSEKTKDALFDDEIIEMAKIKLKILNTKYGKRFYFVYRNRFYNESEESYLGFERKRGALMHFNSLLLNKFTNKEEEKYFKYHSFDEKPFVKYVITLDTDTKLVLNAAIRLVGAMTHPLNKPVIDEKKHKVISGYAIMQPKIAIDVDVTNKSSYSQLFAGLGGLDLYSTSEFNLYQDVFGVGCFQGKGIYDLEIFDKIINGRFPNNLILSHDLLEGNYLRCAFVDDVELYDDYPSQFLNDSKRHHRWTRGDWQIISWLKKRVKTERGKTVKNPLNTLDKWKIFDNLRRSVVNIFTIILLFYAFTFGKEHTLYYLLIIFLIIIIPIIFHLFCKVIYRSQYSRFLRYYLQLLKDTFACIYKSLIILCLLPFEALMYLDATIKSLYRMFISKKNLLNWITAEEVEKYKNTFKTYILSFKSNYICGILLVILATLFECNYAYIAYAFCYIWFMAPLIMYLLSKDIKKDIKKLNNRQLEDIREIAYRTWNYFETYLTPENNYLIPDNYTVDREERLDDKTSATNIGFSIVSVISAEKLGFIDSDRAVEYINKIIDTIEDLEKWNGHLYNWYGIKNKKQLLPNFISTVDSGNFIACLYVARSYVEKLNDWKLLQKIDDLINKTDFSKLYNEDLKVFSIGYDVNNQYLMPYHYNSFASESRLTSFIAISKEDVSYKHWFSLDKSLAKYKYHKGLVSWSGSMFEYFMPHIFMKSFKHTLLDESYQFSSFVQQDYIASKNKNLPWGISECAYNNLDDSLNYRYASFGVPQLRFRGKDEDVLVISPYSSLLAISQNELSVFNNIKKFKKLNMYSTYGFYDSYDANDKTEVKVYYAHHQGMILASLTNYLASEYIQNSFHENKKFEANEMLLKEKVQLKPYIDQKIVKYKKQTYEIEMIENDIKEIFEYGDYKESGILSNGKYSVIIDNNGVGFSKYKNLYINRYKTYSTHEYGMFLYVKNLDNKMVWSNTYEPTKAKPDRYCTVFSSDKIKYIREDDDIITTTEIIVLKDYQGEIRKVTITNQKEKPVELELTSFTESILSKFDDEVAHPAFNGLKLSNYFDKEIEAIVLKRKSVSKPGVTYFVCHKMFIDEYEGALEYETSRYNFLGRNGSIEKPNTVINSTKLNMSSGNALDTIMSIRKKITLEPNEEKSIYLITGFAKSNDHIVEIATKYSSEEKIKQEFELATIYNNLQISYSNLTGYQLSLYNKLIRYLYQPRVLSDARKRLLKDNRLTIKTLWKYGISGSRPIIAAIITDIENLGFVKEIMQFFEFCQSKAIYIDVVIINDCEEKQLVSKYIDKYLFRIKNLNNYEVEGTVYNISGDDIDLEEKGLIHIASTIFIDTEVNLSIEDQLRYIDNNMIYNVADIEVIKPKKIEVKDLTYYNGYGGYDKDGREYVIDSNTPVSWFNVIASPSFGTVMSNDMSGFTYSGNSREYKLTSWSNDTTSSYVSEAFIINDKLFIPSVTKHGFGYTKYLSHYQGLDIEITTFVSLNDQVKFYLLNITNTLKEKVKLDNLVFKFRPVFGVSEEYTNKFIVSEFNKEENYLEIKNTYNIHFQNHKGYVTSTEEIVEFNDYIVDKEIKLNFEINPKEEKTISINMGISLNNDIKKLVSKYNSVKKITKELLDVNNYWSNILNTIQVKTIDKSFDYMINGWYLYQTYASRLYAKSGFYQVGGAYGFRDQLQDSMSLLYSNPDFTKEQILKHANHQFKEGDVLHWWHEELMFGSRTKFSDDYLWLIYVTNEYIKVTNDKSILDIKVGFVEGDMLNYNEDEIGMYYNYIDEKITLYEHLKLCINKSLNQFGSHNLSLMGSGDWSDGMNKVGNKGKGESIWVSFFLYDLLLKMADISKEKDNKWSKELLVKAENLKVNINKYAWEDNWYIRAFFDNGDPLGSITNNECQIDLISQAFSILTDIANNNQQQFVINSVEEHLVDRENNIIKLLTPAFKNPENNPGYIASYPPGVRENGGQYTHAAMWYILALIKANEIDRAYEYYQMINPINRTLDKKATDKYKVEPYVIAADIYSNKDYSGRGGWTWYTGSSSWAYKVGLENIIGFKKIGNILKIEPNIPSSWKNFEIKYKYQNSKYIIKVNRSNKKSITIDGKKIVEDYIKLVDDKKEHTVIVDFGG